MIGPLGKPHWLPVDDWRKLLAFHGGAPRCARCGTAEDLAVDHIIPRKYGGQHDLSNLQFLCRRHNSAKGSRDDHYWSHEFYWDQTPNMAAMRTLQQNVYKLLTLDPDISRWFSLPASHIAQKLYLTAAVVASGKTLAVPMTALAY